MPDHGIDWESLPGPAIHLIAKHLSEQLPSDEQISRKDVVEKLRVLNQLNTHWNYELGHPDAAVAYDKYSSKDQHRWYDYAAGFLKPSCVDYIENLNFDYNYFPHNIMQFVLGNLLPLSTQITLRDEKGNETRVPLSKFQFVSNNKTIALKWNSEKKDDKRLYIITDTKTMIAEQIPHIESERKIQMCLTDGGCLVANKSGKIYLVNTETGESNFMPKRGFLNVYGNTLFVNSEEDEQTQIQLFTIENVSFHLLTEFVIDSVGCGYDNSIAVDESSIYFASREGTITKYNYNGDLLWSVTYDKLAHKKMYLAIDEVDNRLFILSQSDGNRAIEISMLSTKDGSNILKTKDDDSNSVDNTINVRRMVGYPKFIDSVCGMKYVNGYLYVSSTLEARYPSYYSVWRF